MYLASAYPNSDLSVGQLVTIALVVAACLTCWLVGVYLADRPPRPGHHQAAALPPDAMPPGAMAAVTGQHAVAGENEEGKTHGMAA